MATSSDIDDRAARPTISRIAERVTIVQPALPSYRVDLFDRMAAILGDRFRVYASPANMGVLTRH